jgi:hypothetical protein
MKVASIGECMVEFSQAEDGLFRRGFGGDTLNTALYLARLGIDTSYVTALGDDALSQAMLAAWRGEGIRTDQVIRVAGRVPGLYMIERDAGGARSFLYWPDRAPARSRRCMRCLTLPRSRIRQAIPSVAQFGDHHRFSEQLGERLTIWRCLIPGYFLGKQRQQHLVPFFVTRRTAFALRNQHFVKRDVLLANETLHCDLHRS